MIFKQREGTIGLYMAQEMESPYGKLDAIKRTSGFLTWVSPENAREFTFSIQEMYGVGSQEDFAAAQGAKGMADAGLVAGQKQK